MSLKKDYTKTYHFWIFICNFSTKSANSSFSFLTVWYLMLCRAPAYLTEIEFTSSALQIVRYMSQISRKRWRLETTKKHVITSKHTQWHIGLGNKSRPVIFCIGQNVSGWPKTFVVSIITKAIISLNPFLCI